MQENCSHIKVEPRNLFYYLWGGENKQTKKKLSSTTELGRHVTSHQLQPKSKQITQLHITGALASFAPYDRKSKMVA